MRVKHDMVDVVECPVCNTFCVPDNGGFCCDEHRNEHAGKVSIEKDKELVEDVTDDQIIEEERA